MYVRCVCLIQLSKYAKYRRLRETGSCFCHFLPRRRLKTRLSNLDKSLECHTTYLWCALSCKFSINYWFTTYYSILYYFTAYNSILRHFTTLIFGKYTQETLILALLFQPEKIKFHIPFARQKADALVTKCKPFVTTYKITKV